MSEGVPSCGHADLHVHSSASDGQLSPAEVVSLAASKGVAVLSLTDHDSTEGVEEAIAAARSLPLFVIPGVELNAQTPHGEAHILGYFVDPQDRLLLRRLNERRNVRGRRAELMLRRLAGIGYKLSLSRLQEIAEGGSIGRPHVARALVEAGYVQDVEEAFRRLIRKGAPGYVPTPVLSAAEAIAWVIEAGGIPTLAHPIQITQAVNGLVKSGLQGLEVYYGAYSGEDMAFLAGLADSFGLLRTGGSDFHGPSILSSAELGNVSLPWQDVERLLRLRRQGPRRRATGLQPGRGQIAV